MGELSDNILLKLIAGFHIIFVCFIILVPFMNSNYLLMMHIIIVPFVMLHWVYNNNICALTVMEHKLREKITGEKFDRKKCISARIIEPIYDFKSNHKTRSQLIYGLTTLLLFISIGKLYYRYKTGCIKSWRDLFIV
jgi:hypothetical protein